MFSCTVGLVSMLQNSQNYNTLVPEMLLYTQSRVPVFVFVEPLARSYPSPLDCVCDFAQVVLVGRVRGANSRRCTTRVDTCTTPGTQTTTQLKKRSVSLCESLSTKVG